MFVYLCGVDLEYVAQLWGSSIELGSSLQHYFVPTSRPSGNAPAIHVKRWVHSLHSARNSLHKKLQFIHIKRKSLPAVHNIGFHDRMPMEILEHTQ